ncbi:MAG TPA: thioesterase family protein [bacterium]|nr:thioesterase family protein [bacterium]
MNYYDYEYRVRYGDTDKMGISYYANYFIWFESARTEYFRALGLPYTRCEEQGYFLPVVETNARYFSPCTYDDLILVRVSVAYARQTSMRFEYQVFLKGSPKLLVAGFSVHVFVNKSMRPVRIPSGIHDIITPFSLLNS